MKMTETLYRVVSTVEYTNGEKRVYDEIFTNRKKYDKEVRTMQESKAFNEGVGHKMQVDTFIGTVTWEQL